MLTPKDIETKKFSKAKNGGYQPEEVEYFLDEIHDDYAALLAERDHLKNKLDSLSDKIDKLTESKKELEKKLSDPQSIYNETLASANAKADKIVFEAQNYAKKLIEAAHVEAERQQDVSNRFVSEVESFKSKLLSIYENHVKLISSIPVIQIDEISTESKTLEMLENSTVDASPEEVEDVPAVDTKEEIAEINEHGVEYEENLAESAEAGADEEAPEVEEEKAEPYVPSRYSSDEDFDDADEEDTEVASKAEETKNLRREAEFSYHTDDFSRRTEEKDPDTAIDGLFDPDETDKKKKKKKFSFFGFVKDSDDDEEFDDDFSDDDYFDDYDEE